MTARPFVGWQVQDNGVSVQGVLTAAIAAFCGETVHVHGAGRTDAGVHALGQVAHVDLAKAWDTDTVRDALNAASAARIRSRCSPPSAAADDFDARFSARQAPLPLSHRQPPRRSRRSTPAARWRVPRPLDAAAMHAAAQRLVGQHDFTTFRAAECQAKSPVKTLDRLDVERDGDEVAHVRASARSFLHHQVRSMVGSLVHGRRRQMERRRSRRALAAATARLRSRRPAGRAVPDAGGLRSGQHRAHVARMLPTPSFRRALARTRNQAEGPHARRGSGFTAARCPE